MLTNKYNTCAAHHPLAADILNSNINHERMSYEGYG